MCVITIVLGFRNKTGHGYEYEWNSIDRIYPTFTFNNDLKITNHSFALKLFTFFSTYIYPINCNFSFWYEESLMFHVHFTVVFIKVLDNI